jgi:hypothetical protein
MKNVLLKIMAEFGAGVLVVLHVAVLWQHPHELKCRTPILNVSQFSILT